MAYNPSGLGFSLSREVRSLIRTDAWLVPRRAGNHGNFEGVTIEPYGQDALFPDIEDKCGYLFGSQVK
jgi:hypothetical protein